jgi:hypothetical protein
MLDEILHGKRLGRYVPIIGWVRRESTTDTAAAGHTE